MYVSGAHDGIRAFRLGFELMLIGRDEFGSYELLKTCRDGTSCEVEIHKGDKYRVRHIEGPDPCVHQLE